jgi:hypothetical protein
VQVECLTQGRYEPGAQLIKCDRPGGHTQGRSMLGNSSRCSLTCFLVSCLESWAPCLGYQRLGNPGALSWPAWLPVLGDAGFPGLPALPLVDDCLLSLMQGPAEGSQAASGPPWLEPLKHARSDQSRGTNKSQLETICNHMLSGVI